MSDAVNRTLTVAGEASVMDPFAIPLFGLAERRLAWADRREQVLAQNVANIDTPAWKAKDLTPFATTLSAASAAGTLSRTLPAHLGGTASGEMDARVVAEGGRQIDGNAVSLDQELMKVADTDTVQQLVTTIYHSYLGLFRTALGQGSAG
jgi:flagellar basal-body rod protein FlgB